MEGMPRLGRVPSVALTIAAAVSVALVVAGFLAPVYESTSSSSTGEVVRGSATLVGVNGRGAVVVLCVPLLVTLAVGCALRRSSRRAAMPIAWTLTGLLAVLNLLALLSIGVFVLPITAALVIACATCRPESKHPDSAAHAAGAV